MPSKKSIPDMFSTSLSTDHRRTASLSSYRTRLPSSKLFQLFGSFSHSSHKSTHRRSTSDTGPISFNNFKSSTSPSRHPRYQHVLQKPRRSRSETRSFKDLIPSASSWLEDFTAKLVGPSSYSKRQELYESITLKGCEEETWTEVVKQKEVETNFKQINKNKKKIDLVKEENLVTESRDGSEVRPFLIERELDPIVEVEDPRPIRRSFIDHGRTASYDHHQGNAGIKTVGRLSVSELGVPELSTGYQPSSSYKPVQCIPHKGTPSKPYNQATGYLFTETRARSRSSYPSPMISKAHSRYSYQDPRPIYGQEDLYNDDELAKEKETPNEDQALIRLVRTESQEIQSDTLSRLPRIDPSRSISSSYITHRSFPKDQANEDLPISLSSSSSSNQTSIIHHLYQDEEPVESTMNLSTSSFGKQINSSKRSSLKTQTHQTRNQHRVVNDENWNDDLVDSSSALRGKKQLYKRTSSSLHPHPHPNTKTKTHPNPNTQAKEVMSGLINLINI
ncbi:uncharacterized protein MELLADRAFT_110429 [Melampsora larici-populina 98AG31]|uniref:Uncharacterized protein n=1 Tax=Melampsora larici-populina (strain 98AG31 / pathotype 3-4-7) TaxID=747676 RepID=F4RZS6_MELLP|nr:uncharacterized protein MELLADRAFT_110429 [Melampsora larici-populina 98AG31]EGG02054.1 hypothetical protein MELLADRAFT_110429 [Melampsora larici-populina 98AG31]